jgi:predicted ester cyclase
VAGTHLGTVMGAPATGKRASFAFIDIYRIADGRIVETWHVEDVAGMFGQLGLMGS